ncbi:hypothetical protein BDZ94DRAFT_1197820 [Collybia nuda]|uniref:Uncharacterized protein n=1 Tax=Collybia nuda TaxID=64659 RepID=A0A9P5Y0J2_9AGAR|nr:hypothetical protein BDZ94DRAFT_1197820 [Collybia nuda]
MLPPALLELTLFRVSGTNASRLSTRVSPSARRSMHFAALASRVSPSVPYDYPTASGSREGTSSIGRKKARTLQGELAVRPGNPMTDTFSELDKRVKALEVAAVSEISSMDPLHFTEEHLMNLYEDLLALPPSEKSVAKSDAHPQIEEDLAIINRVDQRLLSSADVGEEAAGSAGAHEVPLTQPYQRVLSRARNIISRIETVRSSIHAPSNSKPADVPISILSVAESEALIRICIQARDGNAAAFALDLMKRSGMPLTDDSVTGVLRLYAEEGRVRDLEKVMTTCLTTFPTPQQRHLHIKAHIRATPPNTLPTSALDMLHSYESQSHPAPMKTYTSVISTLFSTKISLGRAQGWDLFSHMRYVAHPDPDVPLYTTMIRACASPISSSRSSEPERALDLWTEMTVDRRLLPTVGAYDAIILACARSGLKIYVNEAFRLAKQMLDSHRDARGYSAFAPDRKTFCALLEGAKRIGDLSRARWILAEIVNGRRNENGAVVEEGVDEEVMMHIFHTYAAYRPPFQRTLVTGKASDTSVSPSQRLLPGPNSSTTLRKENHIANSDHTSPSFTHIPPQSRAEVIHEVKSLFDRILQDTGREIDQDSDFNSAFPIDNKFGGVTLTTRLLNSYLSVYYKHSSLETSRDLFRSLFDKYDVPRTPRTFVEALERCGNARRGRERVIAMEFSDELWAQWRAVEDAGEDGRPHNGRMVERAHIAYIRVLALTGNTDRAVHQVRAFAQRYPPSALRVPFEKPSLRSTRTVLVGERPLVRLTSTIEVPDDNVPPLLMFDDLEVLHHRLVAKENSGVEIGYLTYLCRAYEWSLRVRRNEAMKAAPPKTKNT